MLSRVKNIIMVGFSHRTYAVLCFTHFVGFVNKYLKVEASVTTAMSASGENV